ncbi:MAG TPA: DUF2167 domain-containing protein [Hyphomonadaceae bacterium]|nr:DUF2167 domain-containing protein [Hyphomonadaceae bacterium]
MFRTIIIASCVAFAALGAAAQQPSPETLPEAGAQAAPEAAREMSEEEIRAALAKEREEFEKTITRRSGAVDIAAGHATLTIPAGYYYLDKADTKRVLEDAWGNPPDDSPEGMLFPDELSAVDFESWGVVLTYEDSGYVSDADAASINYDLLLRDMKEGNKQENRERKRLNYPTIELVGWATQPRYDAKAHKLYWAKDLIFEGEDIHTLNYDMRVLGRKGVLQMKFVANIEALEKIEQASPAVLASAEFKPGFRYEEFDPAVDKKSDYTLAGLIAGGAGLAVAQKTGLLAGALLLLKKLWYLIAIGGLAVFGFIKRLISGEGKAPKKGEAAAAPLDAQLFPDQQPSDKPNPPPG